MCVALLVRFFGFVSFDFHSFHLEIGIVKPLLLGMMDFRPFEYTKYFGLFDEKKHIIIERQAPTHHGAHSNLN